jgi:hypothetical protein
MNSRSLIYWSIPPLTTKVGLNSPQYFINMCMGHHRPNFKLGWMWHTPPSKKPTSSSAQHTHNRANDNQELSLLAHATVRPVPAHVPRRAPRRAYTHNEPHVRAPDSHAPVATKVGSDIICNTPKSKWLKFTLRAERTTPTTISLTLLFSLRVKGLTRGWWDGF